ncbi:hypothetical protein BB561_004973 [Smittium simulii]|uniref:Uncharacterized protein n=1 Tax=Smittium simulii TaxID=133385 RepID=A0A2T9YD23_9FUNG|nr:hypothetical protein BB561_004973 [Smittium simulii]
MISEIRATLHHQDNIIFDKVFSSETPAVSQNPTVQAHFGALSTALKDAQTETNICLTNFISSLSPQNLSNSNILPEQPPQEQAPQPAHSASTPDSRLTKKQKSSEISS